jgi:N-acetylmuramoyl-L-alanine amidase
MIKRIRTTAAIIIVFAIASAFTLMKPLVAQNGKNAVKTVIIDPGHGGLFPGTHGLISKEKEVTLEISLKLGEAIEKEFPDIKVIYTRTTDACAGGATNLRDDLRNRAQIANQSRGDLFISIHCNATPQPAGGWYAKRVVGHKKVTRMVGKGKKRRKKIVNEPIYESYWVKNTRTGTETYIWASDRSIIKGAAIDETGETLVDSTAEASAFDIGSPEAKIRSQLYEKNFFYNSTLLSRYVEDQFSARGRTSYGVKQRNVGIQVLQATGMPSILVETGFLTNKEEEEYLNSRKGQDEVVADIVEALRTYKNQLENKGKTKPVTSQK